jgi:sugar phosphate isomerase/epimerase
VGNSFKAAGRRLAGPGRVTIEPVCIFSKHLQWLGYEQMAETAAEIGFEGIDLTVRPNGHVAPQQVARDLPRAWQAAKKAGLSMPMITTGINDPEDPSTEMILGAAADLGVRYYRLGYFRYDDSVPVTETLDSVRMKLAGLAELNRKLSICGDYQNHAGRNYVGASLWDLWYLMQDLEPTLIGCQFDLRHATVEGALNWPVDLRLLSNRVHSIVAKDFRWEIQQKSASVRDCPLGEGIAQFQEFFGVLASAEFSGPVSVHYEYPLGGAEHGARELTLDRESVLSAMRRDLGVLKGWISGAG